MSSTGVIKRSISASLLTDDLIKTFEHSAPAEAERTELVTDEEMADLWAFHLALADGLTEVEIRKRDPDLYRRLQARYLTQAELTRDRLNQLPYR